MYDIAIIGAGPAGATLARLIGETYKVLLVDKRPLFEPNIEKSLGKCCGGLLAPDAQKMLGFLGLGLPQQVLVDPQLFVVRTIDLHDKIEKYYQRHYINIDREKFELLKKKLHDHGFWSAKTFKKHAALLLRPVKMNQPCNGKGDIALIGEAAGWISPSSAEGLSYAFKSAEIMADVLKQGTDNMLKRYNKRTRKMRFNILLKNLKSPFMYSPWLRHKVMSLGLHAMKISTDKNE
jgi:flavin-dependent dehydrogenase